MKFASPINSVLLASAVVMHLTATAAINKCTGADGKLVFSDQPCTSGQMTTAIKADAKPASAPIAKPPNAASLPKVGTAESNSSLHLLDVLCKEDRDRLAASTAKAQGSSNLEILALSKARLEERCNTAARLAAAEYDVATQTSICKMEHDGLAATEKLPPRQPGYADRAADIAEKEAWLKKNCATAAR